MRAKQLDELGIAGVGKFRRMSRNASCPVFIIVGISRDEGDDDDGFDQRAENGAGVGTRAPSHFSDANHTEDECERHEQRSDFVCSGVKIIEHGAKMKTAILVVLLLILVVLGGIYWNQARERDDRLKAGSRGASCPAKSGSGNGRRPEGAKTGIRPASRRG